MAVSTPPTFSSIRTEFASLGTSNSFYAYRRGGGIIPSSYTGVGDGSAGDPLKLSQFAGLSAYEQQIIYVEALDSSEYYPDPIGDWDYFYNHSSTSITPGTSSRISNGTWWEIHWEYSYGVYAWSNGRVYFNIKRLATYGAIPNSGWSTVTIISPAVGTTVYNRTDLTFGTFNDGTYEYASWATSSALNVGDPFLGGAFNASPATVTVRFQ